MKTSIATTKAKVLNMEPDQEHAVPRMVQDALARVHATVNDVLAAAEANIGNVVISGTLSVQGFADASLKLVFETRTVEDRKEAIAQLQRGFSHYRFTGVGFLPSRASPFRSVVYGTLLYSTPSAG